MQVHLGWRGEPHTAVPSLSCAEGAWRMSLQGGSCKKTISNDLHCDSRSTTRSLGDVAILNDRTLIFCNVVLNIRKDWVR